MLFTLQVSILSEQKLEFAEREQLQYPQFTNEPRRQKRARAHRTSHQRLLPPLPLEQIERKERKKPREAQTLASQDLPKKHPALLKERRDTKENPGRQDFRRSQRKDIGVVEAKLANKVSANKSSKRFHYAESQTKNICHNLILSSKPNATPRK